MFTPYSQSRMEKEEMTYALLFLNAVLLWYWTYTIQNKTCPAWLSYLGASFACVGIVFSLLALTS